MNSLKEHVNYCMDILKKTRANKSQCQIGSTLKHEFNIESGKLNLLRTTHDTSLSIDAILNSQKGSISGNQVTKDSIDKAIADVIDIAQTSQPDEAHDIAPFQLPQEFIDSDTTYDLDLMYDRATQFLKQVKEKFPTIQLGQSILSHVKFDRIYLNSNGVDFFSSQGAYQCSIMFCAKDGDKVSSFNYTGFITKDLNKPLLDYGYLEELLRQTTEQVNTNSIKGKFVGDVVITPMALNDFIYYLTGVISDTAIITGTSPYMDSLNKQIASPEFSLYSEPLSPELGVNSYFTSDGFKTENGVIVDKGVLKNFQLSLYGANKTGFPRAVNPGAYYVIPYGDKKYEDIIKSVKRGILLVRFSGGSPSRNGDFSGVAKNSYLIEDGEIKYPLSESMVSGNMVEAFKSIEAISHERINNGVSILPWFKVSGLTLSGK